MRSAIRAGIEVVASFLLVVGTPIEIGSPPWWRNPHIAHILNLDARQADTIDRFYRESLRQHRASAVAAETAHATFNHLLKMDAADDMLIQAAFAAIEADAATNRVRTLMLCRMHRVLRPAQRSALRLIASRTSARTARLGQRRNRPLPDFLPW